MLQVVIKNPVEAGAVATIIKKMPFLEKAYRVTVKQIKSTRSLEQNAKMWAMLTDIANQKEYAGEMRSKEDWKDLMTAAVQLERDGQSIVPGVNGGIVILGLHTRNMTIAAMTELIEFMHAWGAENDIEWSDA